MLKYKRKKEEEEEEEENASSWERRQERNLLQNPTGIYSTDLLTEWQLQTKELRKEM